MQIHYWKFFQNEWEWREEANGPVVFWRSWKCWSCVLYSPTGLAEGSSSNPAGWKDWYCWTDCADCQVSLIYKMTLLIAIIWPSLQRSRSAGPVQWSFSLSGQAAYLLNHKICYLWGLFLIMMIYVVWEFVCRCPSSKLPPMVRRFHSHSAWWWLLELELVEGLSVLRVTWSMWGCRMISNYLPNRDESKEFFRPPCVKT